MLRAQGLEIVASKLILNTITLAAGATWVALGNNQGSPGSPAAATLALDGTGAPVACNQILVGNATGVTLSFGFALNGQTSPTGETFEVPSGTSWTFRGINNVAQLMVRRADLGDTPVNFKAVAEGV